MKIKGTYYCAACMKQTEGQDNCPYCGFRQKEESAATRYLPPGTVLAERYVLGTVLGQGSFGITYIGMDTLFESVIAVKECFPRNHVYRHVTGELGHEVLLYDEESQNDYAQMMEKFLDEAKRLTQFREVEGIVSVHDFFYANNTAYIVMEYVRGISLKAYVEERGPMDGEWVLKHMDLLMSALEQIHETGLIHRDISPDNIIVTPSGEFVLLDFGSARETNIEVEKSLTVVFKRGFSPAEQYRSRGKQGVWTDVYAMCATIYFCLTGRVPDESLERLFVDETPSLLSMPEIELSRGQKKAIMKGISVNVKERYSCIRELRGALYEEKGSGVWKKKIVKVSCVVGFVAALGSYMVWHGSVSPAGMKRIPPIVEKNDTEPSPVRNTSTPVPEKTYRVPSVVGMSYKSAKKALRKQKMKPVLKWKTSEKRENTVIAQSIRKGKRVRAGKGIWITVSKGKPDIGTKVPAQTPAPTKRASVPGSRTTPKPPKVNLDGMIE